MSALEYFRLPEADATSGEAPPPSAPPPAPPPSAEDLPVALLDALWAAAEHGRLEEVKKLLSKVEREDLKKALPAALWPAAARGRLEVVKELLSKVEREDLKKALPDALSAAAVWGRLDLSKMEREDFQEALHALKVAADCGRLQVVIELRNFVDCEEDCPPLVDVTSFCSLLHDVGPEINDLSDALVHEAETELVRMPAYPLVRNPLVGKTNWGETWGLAAWGKSVFLQDRYGEAFDLLPVLDKICSYYWRHRNVRCTEAEVRLAGADSEEAVEALATTPNRSFLGSTAATAIICYAWREVFHMHMIDSVLYVLALCALCNLTSSLSFYFLCVLLFKRIAEETFQMFEAVRHRHREAFVSIGTVFDWLNILVVYVGLTAAHNSLHNDAFEHGSVGRMAIAAMSGGRWVQFLYYLRGLRVVGPRFLPIIYAIFELKVFVLILVFVFAGVFHAYTKANVFEDRFKTFRTLLRAAIFLDFDLHDMEGRDEYYVENSDGRLVARDEPRTANFNLVLVLFSVSTMGIGIVPCFFLDHSG